ncbi:unnamed protein product [Caenorhabditis brenneri]
MTPKLLFRMAEPGDKEAIIKFLDTHFAKEEPCARALKLTPEMSHNTFQTTADRCLRYPFSMVVLNENEEIVACLLASVWNRTDPVEKADYDDEGAPENLRLFLRFLNSAHEDFWKIAPPHIQSVIHGEIASVAPEFTRLGIATKLVTTNMTKANLKKFNIGGFMSETTSLANQKLMKKAGFKCLKELPYSMIVDSKGDQVLQLDDGTTSLHLNFKGAEDFGDILD